MLHLAAESMDFFSGTTRKAAAQCQVSQDAPLRKAAEAGAPAQGWCRHQ